MARPVAAGLDALWRCDWPMHGLGELEAAQDSGPDAGQAECVSASSHRLANQGAANRDDTAIIQPPCRRRAAKQTFGFAVA